MSTTTTTTKFALIGATGTVGGQVLETILEKTVTDKVNCHVRSGKKLRDQFSARLKAKTTTIQQADFDDRVTIYEGDMTSIDTLQDCIKDTQVVFLCAASSRNMPGCRIARDQADAVITVLRKIRAESSNIRLPKLVVLSSAGTEERLMADTPSLLRAALFNANSHIYTDLMAAETRLRDQPDDLVTAVFVKPGGLSNDIAHGHALDEEKSQTFLSFADLAGAMLDVGQRAIEEGGERWDGKCVSVTSPTRKARIEWSAVPLLLGRLLAHYFPFLYDYVP